MPPLEGVRVGDGAIVASLPHPHPDELALDTTAVRFGVLTSTPPAALDVVVEKTGGDEQSVLLEPTGSDPTSGLPIGTTEKNLRSAIHTEMYESSEMYLDFAQTARDEGFTEIAEWFETLARAEKSNASRFQKALDELEG